MEELYWVLMYFHLQSFQTDFALLHLQNERNVDILGLKSSSVWEGLAVGTNQWRTLNGVTNNQVSNKLHWITKKKAKKKKTKGGRQSRAKKKD